MRNVPIIAIILLMFVLGVVGQSDSVDGVKIPPKLQIVDFDKIYESVVIARQSLKKGEFETTEQYNLRSSAPIKLTNDLTANDTFILMHPGRGLASYDADSQKMLVEIKSSDSSRTRYPKFEVEQSEKPLGSYVGSNAYGGRTTVTKIARTTKSLIVQNFNVYQKDAKFTAEFGVLLKDAPTTKESLQVLYFLQLVGPYAADSFYTIEPTFSRPTELQLSEHSLVGNLKEIWIIDNRSKNVLFKIESVDGYIADPGQIKLATIQVPTEGGKVITRVSARRSDAAKKAGARGDVEVEVEIDEGGNVIAATAISGHPLLKSPAEEAAWQTKFSPKLFDGKPIKWKTTLKYIWLDD
ncbi:MAG TPA: energy transducer TonB [Pyrinomonadaceae bacterium]|nr:energy transducer TonB [Pyrinomonadaceae bacterium]